MEEDLDTLHQNPLSPAHHYILSPHQLCRSRVAVTLPTSDADLQQGPAPCHSSQILVLGASCWDARSGAAHYTAIAVRFWLF